MPIHMIRERATAEQLAELQDPANWDQENFVEVHPAEGHAYHAKVTIRLDAEMLDALEDAANRAGVWLPYYIRDAALEKARTARQHA